MSQEIKLLVPGIPFIPEQPPHFIQTRVTEWLDRADLTEHAFDGTWRILVSNNLLRYDVMERWVKKDEDYFMEHCIRMMK